MFVDGRQIDGHSTVDADICIVGAGAAGLTIACQFAHSETRVCLLESGALDFNWRTQALYEGRNVGLEYFALDMCQIRYFGGNTNGWGGWCRPLDAIDFSDRPWVEGGGWPFSQNELEPYYRAAHTMCEIPTPHYDVEETARQLGAKPLPLDPTKLAATVYQFSPPTRFGRVYRDVIAAARNITCILNANVLRINLTLDARQVRDLSVGCFNGPGFRVTARHFVLAAGGVENARLLLLSNDIAANGIGNRHDLVGRYFMEHPHTMRVLTSTQPPAAFSFYGIGFRNRGLSVRLSLPPAVQAADGLLNYSANIHPVYRAHTSAAWVSFRKLVLSLDPRRRCDPYIRMAPYEKKGVSLTQLYEIVRRLDKVAAAAFLHVFRPNRLASGFLLESKSEQAPNWRSRVRLQQDRDAFGLNRVELDWRTLPIDRRTVIRGEEIIDQELRRLGMGELAPLHPSEIEAWPANLEGGWHQIGTTRMSADPHRGVVDANGKVHDVANLFIAGSSVFPSCGAAPPTLTIVAMALRLADHLNRVMRAQREAVEIAAQVGGG